MNKENLHRLYAVPIVRAIFVGARKTRIIIIIIIIIIPDDINHGRGVDVSNILTISHCCVANYKSK